MRWTGPLESDLKSDGCTLVAPVPPERWPYGPPEAHKDCCILHAGGLFCDCAASAADECEDPPLVTWSQLRHARERSGISLDDMGRRTGWGAALTAERERQSGYASPWVIELYKRRI